MDNSDNGIEKAHVIGIDDAIRFHQDGARRWRMPHKRLIGPGRDTDSMDFRGVRAAFKATESLPREYDPEGHRLPVNPELVKTHMDLGLTAIREAGTLPLDDKFVGGYQRWTDAIVHEAAEQAER